MAVCLSVWGCLPITGSSQVGIRPDRCGYLFVMHSNFGGLFFVTYKSRLPKSVSSISVTVNTKTLC
jgi:hypothetical protein